jgi:hypothetical protein
MKSVWHRFPKATFAAVENALAHLAKSDHSVVDNDDKEEIASLLEAARKGFATQENLDLDLQELVLFLEFMLFAGDFAEPNRLSDALARIRRYQKK